MQEKNDANPMDLLFQKKNTIHQRVNPSYTSIRWLARKHLGLTEVQGWEERCNRLGWDFSTPNINESKKPLGTSHFTMKDANMCPWEISFLYMDKSKCAISMVEKEYSNNRRSLIMFIFVDDFTSKGKIPTRQLSSSISSLLEGCLMCNQRP